MASVRAHVDRAVALHRRAAATLALAARALSRPHAAPAPQQAYAAQRDLATRLQDLATKVAPGWLSVPLDKAGAHSDSPLGKTPGDAVQAVVAAPAAADPVGATAAPTVATQDGGRRDVGRGDTAATSTGNLTHNDRDPSGTGVPAPRESEEESGVAASLPTYIRIGTAYPLDDVSFPVIVPLLGVGHLAIDADARDPRVAGLLRSLVVRLLASAPPATLRVRVVDAATATFTGFHGIEPVMPEPVTDRAGLRAALAEGEARVRAAQSATDSGGPSAKLLLVVASLPELTEGPDLARIAALAQYGPAVGVHLLIAGWPPPPLTADTTQGPLRHCTHVTVRNPYAWVGDPPGASFSGAPHGPGRLNAPVLLDPDPPVPVVRQVCERVADEVRSNAAVTLRHLLAAPLWQASSADGLVTVVGQGPDGPVRLAFDDATPHWMVGGRSGGGKTAFLLDVLYGLALRYSPDELALYLLDFKEGVSFSEFTPSSRDPSWLPHARAVGIESDREYGLAVLRELDAEMTRRAAAYKAAGVTRYRDLRRERPDSPPMPRVVCVVDEFQVLLAGNDTLARETTALLESLARKGRSYGIHLVLCSQTVRGVEALYAKRDSIFGQFPVRVALPGGGDVLDQVVAPAVNPAALPLGNVIVNTAAGAPGFDTLVRFPDPYAEVELLTTVRHRLWQARSEGTAPPHVFEGYASARLDADPTFARLLATEPRAEEPPRALVGRRIDVVGSTAGFTLDAAPGRHVAVLGPADEGAAILASAARSLAAQLAPGSARFVLAPLVPAAHELLDHVTQQVTGAGHAVETIEAARLPHVLRELTEAEGEDAHAPRTPRTYLVGFGLDAASTALARRDPSTGRAGTDDLRTLLHTGSAHGIHLLGWWRTVRKFSDDTGGSLAREDIACLVVTNVPGNDVALLLGRPLDWHPRPHRALLHDRHSDHTEVVVPFTDVGPGAS